MLEIENLMIRVPGLPGEFGKSFGEEIMLMVANRLPNGIDNGHIENIELQIPSLNGIDRSQWSAVIADHILRKIKEATR